MPNGFIRKIAFFLKEIACTTVERSVKIPSLFNNFMYYDSLEVFANDKVRIIA